MSGSGYRDDPILQWAEQVAGDASLQSEASYQHFLRLKDEYLSLLRRFTQVTRLSDSYHESLRELNASLSVAARRDHLTGLSNRRDMMEQLAGALSRASRHDEELSVLLIDIDAFKSINDSYGHHEGDAVLIEVARTIRNSLRDHDICGRWGGEEFLVIMPSTDGDAAGRVAQRLVDTVRSSGHTAHGQAVQVTVSVGVAALSRGLDLDSLVMQADAAMYRAKYDGRDRVYVMSASSINPDADE